MSEQLTVMKPQTVSSLQPPAMFALVMLNDDFTPMDFVVEVLISFIHMEKKRAMQTMLDIHHKGEALCGLYTRDIGETKSKQILAFAKQHGYPLRCVLRKTLEKA